MAKSQVVSEPEWQAAREKLLTAEKEATRALDRIAAQRRRLPIVAVRNDYAFEGPEGIVTLLDLFGANDELLVYQFMDVGPNGLCPGCTHLTNNVTDLAALAGAGISWATVSNMPWEQIKRAVAEQGWTMPFYSSRGSTFADDCGAGSGFLLTAFLRDGDEVFRTYSTTNRGVDRLLFSNNMMDLVVWGRQEEWEDSPPGWPQHPTYG